MVKRIKSEITHNLMDIPWMDEAAKQTATQKVTAINIIMTIIIILCL